MGYSVEDKGVVQRVGEFQNYVNEQMSLGARDLAKQLADTSRKGTDILMKYSAFGWTDTVGKNAITRMIIQDAVDNVDNLGARWGFYFSKGELDDIAKQIRKHGTDVTSYTGKGAELMEELFFAGLGQQQLISSAGRPLAWSTKSQPQIYVGAPWLCHEAVGTSSQKHHRQHCTGQQRSRMGIYEAVCAVLCRNVWLA